MRNEKSKLEIFLVEDLARISGRSKVAIWKKCRKSKDGVIYLNGIGSFFVMKNSNPYRFVQLRSDSVHSTQEVKIEVIKLLKELTGYICEECIPVVNQVIENAKNQ